MKTVDSKKAKSPKHKKADKKDNKTVGKENNCMNKVAADGTQKDTTVESKPTQGTRKKKEEQKQQESTKPQEAETSGEECKEIDDLKAYLKNSCKSKRKVLIKPNIPKEWISDLKAKLAKISMASSTR